jgi:hypothetical protein
MKKILTVLMVISFTTPLTVSAGESSCINCHASTQWVSDTSLAAAFLSGDAHNSAGLGCQDCHGGDPGKGFSEGDPQLAMDPAKGYKPPPDRLTVPEFCARCHSNIEYMKQYDPALPADQLELYRTSVHGKLLFGKKDTKVAVCSSCHGAHGILRASDPRSKVYHQNVPGTCRACHSDPAYMRGYEYQGKPIATDQYDRYSKSVHGILVLEKADNAAPACNNCHGNHGATPPSLASVSAACGECHSNNRDYFNASPHKEAFQELGLPECERCHGNHLILAASDSLLGVGPGSFCIQCHDPGTPGYDAAARMKAAIDSLKMAVAEAEQTVSEAERKGVEGGQARFDLGSAKDDLIRVRSVVHTFAVAQVEEVTSPGIKTAEKVRGMALSSLGDIKIRRIGLAISLVLIAFVAFALWRKVKQLDKNTDFIVRQ